MPHTVTCCDQQAAYVAGLWEDKDVRFGHLRVVVWNKNTKNLFQSGCFLIPHWLLLIHTLPRVLSQGRAKTGWDQEVWLTTENLIQTL